MGVGIRGDQWIYSLQSMGVMLVVVFSLVLLPYLFFEAEIISLGEDFIRSDPYEGIVIMVIIIALSLDVILPVPSSLVALAGGSILGGWLGFIVLFSGFMIGAVLGYFLGSIVGKRLGHSLFRRKGYRRVAYMNLSLGTLALIVCRFIPVLAETSVVMAGMAAVPRGRFIVLMVASNAALTAVYMGLVEGVNFFS